MAKYMLFAGLALIALLTLTSAKSGFVQKQQQRYRERIAEASAKLEEQRLGLENSEATTQQVEEYLNTALWLVYTGKILANITMDEQVAQTNGDLRRLVDGGFIPLWPANPLNNWEPMRCLGPGDAFSPGDICFALCPDSYATTIACGKTPVSFDLYIYGPTDDLAQFGSISDNPSNREWDSPPHGALFGLTYYTPSDEHLERAREQARQSKAVK